MIADTTPRTSTADPRATALRRAAVAGSTDVTRDRALVAAMAAVGGGLAVVGGTMPWLSFYAGLQQVRGSDGLTGQALIALGLVSLAAAGAHGIRGGTTTRWLLAALGFLTVALAGFLGIGLLQTFAVLSADPLLVARLEPGLGVVLLGGSAVFATVFAPTDDGAGSAIGRPAASLAHFILAAVLAFAGVVHLVLTPEHIATSTALGLGFLAVGIVQVVLAPLVLVSRTRGFLISASVISMGSVLALIAATTVGLPLVGHGDVMGPLGPVETIDDLAAMTGLAEVVGLVVSMRLLRRPS